MDDRLSCGVKGLDDKMKGGFYRGSVNLITGKTGTGKTMFASSFIYEGLGKQEPGVYVTTEQRETDLKGDIKGMFGWDFEFWEKKSLVKFLAVKPIFPGKTADMEKMEKLIKLYVYDIINSIEAAIKELSAKRVVIDSISIVEMYIQDPYLARTVIAHIVERLKNMGVTAILTGTIPETSEGLSGYGIVEFVADSVLKLDFVPVAEEYKRTITIRKMRRTDHSVLIHPFAIGKDGLRIVEIK